MRELYQYLLDYQKKYFDTKLFLSIAIFLTICLLFNYWLNFEDDYVEASRSVWIKSLNMFLFQGLPFFIVALLVSRHTKYKNWIKDRSFWITFIFGFALIGFSRAHHWGRNLRSFVDPVDYKLVAACGHWVIKLSVYILVLALFYGIYERYRSHLYGFLRFKFDAKPYFILLALALVFIAIGSFFSDIQAYYPRYKPHFGERFSDYHDLPHWVAVIIYEIAYGMSFISVELVYRGFLIFAFYKFFGPYAVLPMVATYCFIHFGKPATEAVSSIFGGYILGIVTIKTRSIWGGVIVHVGVAWAMELFGWLQS